jgi:competence protein ComEA
VVPAERPDESGGVGPVAGWVPQRPELGAVGRPRPPVRWAAARRAVLGVLAVLVVAVLVVLLLVWRAQPSAEAAPRVRRTLPDPAAGSAPSPPAAPAPSPASAAQVVVHVVGAVHRPGLVRLPAGSRVADAVRAAGGMTGSARPASVNLARLLVDGEQLVVQRRGAASLLGAPGALGAAPATGATAGPPAPVDLNSATLEMLDALPGIGPVLAQRILDWRTAHGRFSAVDELGEVSGIGEATLADLRPVVTV